MTKLSRTLLLSLIILLALFSLSHAERIPTIDGLYYYQPAAAVSGIEALWINPAGIGRHRATGYLLSGDYSENKLGDDWGTVIHKNNLAGGYRSLDRETGNVREYIFGTGMPLGNGGTYVGFSYQYFKSGPVELNKDHFWTVGLLSQSNPNFAWGAVFSNLNRSRLNGERTEIEQRYSVAYRPLKDKMTLSVDMTLSTKTRLSNADYIYHVEGVATDGVLLSSWIDSHSNYGVGVRVNLLKHFVGSHNSFNKNGDERTSTVYYGTTSLRQKSVIKSRRRRLSMKMSGRVKENPVQPLFGPKKTSFTSLITSIYRAAEDDSIDEMVLRLSNFSPGLGRAQEIRTALNKFRRQGKRVIVHLGQPSNLSYYIASVCDSILIPPVSQLNLSGLRAELTFYRGLMDKVGIEAEVLKIGPHKSAPERYSHYESSAENRAQLNRLFDDFYDQLVTGIAEGRKLAHDSVRTIIDSGPFTSAEAIELGLVDGLTYADEIRVDFLKKMPEVSFRTYQADTLTNRNWGQTPLVAILPVEGEISFNSKGSLVSPATDATPGRLAQSLKKAVADKNVRAIVLRVNSPGGLAMAGDEIYHQVEKAARIKPLVISMANVAASAGYYIATPGEKIFANPGCITGSIGIYGGKPNLSSMYEKLSIGKELYTRGKHAGMESWLRPFTATEREKYQTGLKAFYDHFVDLVATSRQLPTDSIDNISQGQVWTGAEAIQNGLVDSIGGLKEAADYAAELAGLTDFRIAAYPVRRTLFTIPSLSRIPFLAGLLSTDSDDLSAIIEESGLVGESGLYARLPFDLTIE